MVAAQRHAEGHLELRRPPQAAEDDVETRGRGQQSRRSMVPTPPDRWVTVACVLTGCPRSRCGGPAAVGPPRSSADAAPLPAGDSVPPPGRHPAAAAPHKHKTPDLSPTGLRTVITEQTLSAPPLEHVRLWDTSSPSPVLPGRTGRAACERCGRGPGTSPLYHNRRETKH